MSMPLELEIAIDALADLHENDLTEASDAELRALRRQLDRWSDSATAELSARAKARAAQFNLLHPLEACE
ncbi:MAG: hypothetical protein ACLFS2_12675 [Halochromatium sp.]|uniref:hypothetical protein n=1 Tax=Halochromatium sp. TaxID=2049430 RepID=UPI0030848B6A